MEEFSRHGYGFVLVGERAGRPRRWPRPASRSRTGSARGRAAQLAAFLAGGPPRARAGTPARPRADVCRPRAGGVHVRPWPPAEPGRPPYSRPGIRPSPIASVCTAHRLPVRCDASMSGTLVGGHVQHRAVEDAVGGVLVEMDLAEHLAVRRDHRDPAGDRGGDEQPAVGGEGHAVGHMAVGELAERLRLAAVVHRGSGAPSTRSSRAAGRRRTRSRWGRRPAVRAASRPLPCGPAANSRPGAADVERKSCFRPRLGEVQPAVRAEREIVRPVQLVAATSENSSSTGPVGHDPLDAGHGAGVAAARDVAALGHVDGAVRAEHGAPRRAAGAGVDGNLAAVVDQQSRRCCRRRARSARRPSPPGPPGNRGRERKQHRSRFQG